MEISMPAGLSWIDSHSHLYDEQFSDEDTQRAIDAGVSRIYMPNCDESTVAPMLRVQERFPEHCFPMMGIHPCYVKADFKEQLRFVEEALKACRYWAVGEIGLDYYWDKSLVAEQQQAFAAQIGMAKAANLPVVLHSRESTPDCIRTIREAQDGNLRGIFHCFSGTLEEAREIADLGFLLGIGGVVTFKKSTLPGIVREIPLEQIVLETDAPYLAPVPYRGKRNESAYIPLIGAAVAAIKECAVEEVAAVTTAAALALFEPGSNIGK